MNGMDDIRINTVGVYQIVFYGIGDRNVLMRVPLDFVKILFTGSMNPVFHFVYVTDDRQP